MRRDLGDFQTPPGLVDAVLETLGPIGQRWPRVLEPTCGRGNFLAGLLAHSSPPREVRGIEIQPAHCRAAEELLSRPDNCRTHGTVACADLFGLDLGRDLSWRERGPLLVVGNPPWVTSAELGHPGRRPRPAQVERQGPERPGGADGLRRTSTWPKRSGSSSPASWRRSRRRSRSCARRRWRGASCNSPTAPACPSPTPRSVGSTPRDGSGRRSTRACSAPRSPLRRSEQVPVYPGLRRARAERGARVRARLAGRRIARRTAVVRSPTAPAPRVWRQGLKHDAAAVMELTVEPGTRPAAERCG